MVSTPVEVSDAGATYIPCSWCMHSAGSKATWLTDRKSTRLNSSHGYISYAVFCLKKKKTKNQKKKKKNKNKKTKTKKTKKKKKNKHKKIQIKCR